MPGPAFLEGDRVDLRTIEEEDVEFLHEAINDRSIWRPIGRIDPVNRTQEEEFFEEIICSNDSVNLLVTTGSTPAGMVSLTPDEGLDDSAELGYWIAADHREKGYGTEAVELVTEYGLRQRGFHRVSARVFEFNEPSKRLLESAGFTHEGRHRDGIFIDGEYWDVHWYSVLAPEWTPNDR